MNSLETAAHIGDTVGGISTVAAVILAWFEVRGWRKQKAAERRSDAAAKALVALLSGLDVYREWAAELAWWANYTPNYDEEENPDLQMHQLGKAYERGHKAAQNALVELRSATTLALVHLDRAAVRTLDEAQAMFWQITGEYQEFAAAIAGGAPPEQHLTPLASVCDSYAAKIRDLAERGARDLQPVARLG